MGCELVEHKTHHECQHQSLVDERGPVMILVSTVQGLGLTVEAVRATTGHQTHQCMLVAVTKAINNPRMSWQANQLATRLTEAINSKR